MNNHLDYAYRDMWWNFYDKKFLSWLRKVLFFNILNYSRISFPLDSILNWRDWYWHFKIDRERCWKTINFS